MPWQNHYPIRIKENTFSPFAIGLWSWISSHIWAAQVRGVAPFYLFLDYFYERLNVNITNQIHDSDNCDNRDPVYRNRDRWSYILGMGMKYNSGCLDTTVCNLHVACVSSAKIPRYSLENQRVSGNEISWKVIKWNAHVVLTLYGVMIISRFGISKFPWEIIQRTCS